MIREDNEREAGGEEGGEEINERGGGGEEINK